ncbi:polysaccharide biosynthesis C-terminal domain-containing protein [Methylorubrum extorquens]|uniref:polysaccharide biosynthesis C-terminal domain-containing protein n=1 Tax=Methylorubrum extorquens TaxID=408 RepID=UPI002237D7D4|nr:polysaccharide biosynthesis C-terminal domain-containing protein [Methylorubrum extorquens]UYW25987.1 lipopolysaccharide biosynthesis protein [Methylorubrum extorquens]UYW34206.1 lipopolysaccharide biosynthesis protein [Methylorubrum extorquens]
MPEAHTAPVPPAGLLRRSAGLLRRPPAALAALADQGVVSGFGFLSGIVAARLLGIAEFGHFAMILIVLTFAQALHNALITAPMMTLVGARSGVSKAYAATILTGAFLLCVPGAVFVVIALLIGGMSGETLLAACALMLAQNLQFTLRRLLFAKGRGVQALLMDFARAASFPFIALVIWLEHDVIGSNGFVWLLAATSFATCLPFIVAFGRPILRRPGCVQTGAVFRRHIPLARWLLPIVFVTFVQEQLIWLVAGATLGLEELGGLRAAQYLVGTVLLLLAATENVLPVAAARAHSEGGEAALRRYLMRTGIKLGVPIIAILAVLAIPGAMWLRLIFGAEYAAYANCLHILSVSVVIVLARDLTANYFRAKQNTRVLFASLCVSMVVSLAVVVPLMQAGGVSGAAAAVGAGHLASLIYLVLAARRQSRPASAWPMPGRWRRSLRPAKSAQT